MKGIKAGWLITKAGNVLKNHGFTYEDGMISNIYSNEELDRMEREQTVEKLLDASGKLVMPGFVNAHMHQYGILSRGIPSAGEVVDFETFLKNYWWPYIENRIRKEDVVATAKASAVELIRSGVTAFCDTMEGPFVEEDSLIEQAKVLEEIGIRAIVSLESCERIDRENGEKCLKMNQKAVRWTKEHLSLVRGAICTHTSFTCSEEFIQEAYKMAKEEDALFQFHLSESKYEPEKSIEEKGIRPVNLYAGLGCLDSNTLASQCVKVTGEEIALLKEKQVKTVHMPISNCEVGGGIAPIPEMLEAGLTVSLGTDGYINDFFEVMKEAFLIHKAAKESTSVMPSETVFRMATEMGAKCMNLPAGKIEPGLFADFIVMDDRFLTPVTEQNIFDQVVIHGKKEYLETVVVNGKPLMMDGTLLTINEAQVNQDVKNVAEKFWRCIK